MRRGPGDGANERVRRSIPLRQTDQRHEIHRRQCDSADQAPQTHPPVRLVALTARGRASAAVSTITRHGDEGQAVSGGNFGDADTLHVDRDRAGLAKCRGLSATASIKSSC